MAGGRGPGKVKPYWRCVGMGNRSIQSSWIGSTRSSKRTGLPGSVALRLQNEQALLDEKVGKE